MRTPLISRLLLAALLLAIVVVAVSTLIEFASAIRLATTQAVVEANLVAGNVAHELGRLATEHPQESLPELGRDPDLQAVLMNGLALAPSAVQVAVVDPSGVAVAHTQPSQVGALVPAYPPLPEIRNFAQSLRVLWRIRDRSLTYEASLPLGREGRSFATVKVDIAGVFLWEVVKQAASRGIFSAVVAMSIASLAGILLARMAAGRIRLLAAGAAAIREGRFEQRLPETGIDDFDRLARELNLLGAEFVERWSGRRSPNGSEESSIALLLDQSKVLARLGETAAGVAHELRNQIQMVQCELEALRAADTMPIDEVRARVRSASDGLERVGGAVRAFLKIARVRPLAPETVQINELLRKLAQEMKEEAMLAGSELLLEPDSSLPETWADPEVLTQAVRNVVQNSLQALSQTGGRVWIRSGRAGGDLEVAIQDDGPGIPSSNLGRIFDPYFTTRKDGSGVGLALVRRSIEMHGGAVRIDSSEGKGTTVTMAIPWRAPVAPGARP